MDGFKNSTKTHYMKGGMYEGYAKGGKVSGAAKIAKVMGEFKAGKLHSGSKKGPEVTNPKQAVAIAIGEARKAGARIPVKKKGGGRIDRNMVESTSSAPKKVGLSVEERAELDTLARAERVQAEEANESRIARETRKVSPRAREVTAERRVDTERSIRTPLDRTLSTLPSERGEMPMRRGPAGAGFSVQPLVNSVRNALGFKKGGLSTMPRSKKC